MTKYGINKVLASDSEISFIYNKNVENNLSFVLSILCLKLEIVNLSL